MSARSRRDFFRRLGVSGAALIGTAALRACGAPPTPVLNRITLQPSTAPTTPASPTLTSTPMPSSTPPPTAEGAPPSPAASATSTPHPTATPVPTAGPAYLAVAHGPDPAEITRRAVAALGGMERFVKPGDDVIIKPNICNAYHGPEFASTTNPQVVAEVVRLCLAAGAGRVRVMDNPFAGTPQKAYETSGIAAAVSEAGGQMEIMAPVKYREEEIPNGRRINKWPVYGDALDADVLINIPIAKHHGSTRLTLGMKNLMGVALERSGFHARGLQECIADLNTLVRPHLTIVDAVRILVANGPTGGDLNDVREMDTVIASTDIVAADAYATGLFGLSPDDVTYITLGEELGLGTADIRTLSIEEITL